MTKELLCVKYNRFVSLIEKVNQGFKKGQFSSADKAREFYAENSTEIILLWLYFNPSKSIIHMLKTYDPNILDKDVFTALFRLIDERYNDIYVAMNTYLLDTIADILRQR